MAIAIVAVATPSAISAHEKPVGDAALEAQSPPTASDCSDAHTTLAMNDCLSGLLTKADQRRNAYLDEAMRRYEGETELRDQIMRSDAAFTAYRDAECRAVYEYWKEGSIRGVMHLTCQIEMTDERTHTIWRNWLTYADSTPPILPEPKPTR